MRVRLPLMVQDQALAGVRRLVAEFDVRYEPFFLDGPVTERVAVLDFDDKSGDLLLGTPFFSVATKFGPRGEYQVSDEEKLYRKVNGKKQYIIESDDFIRVSVLGAIMRVLALFEDESVLGRMIHWAFGGSQLLVIPRAGQWANAFYQRKTGSLQFFYFPKTSEGNGEKPRMVYTGLSSTIIAHETTHAILDGIAPDLYHTSTPQSLAIHEALADLVAVMIKFKSPELTMKVLLETNGDIDRPSLFSKIAVEFAREHTGSDALRELYNPDIKLADVSLEPHYLSVVLSSALYEYMIKLYNRRRKVIANQFSEDNEQLLQDGQSAKYSDPFYSAIGEALALAADEFVSFVIPALDFLPPGEASFADVGRAIIASQGILIISENIPNSHKTYLSERLAFMVDSFKKRGISISETTPEIKTEFEHNFLDGVDFGDLINSDWIAYQFANKNREHLAIPSDASLSFEVMPRIVARKRPFSRSGPRQNHLFFKVKWHKTEIMDLQSRGLPTSRRMVVGSTLAIDLDQGKPIALLHTDTDPALRHTRDEMLTMLLERDLLRFGDDALGPLGVKLDGVIQAENAGGALQLSHAAEMLHLAHARS